LTCVCSISIHWGGQRLYYNPQPLCPAIDSLLRPLFRQSPSPRGFALETTIVQYICIHQMMPGGALWATISSKISCFLLRFGLGKTSLISQLHFQRFFWIMTVFLPFSIEFIIQRVGIFIKIPSSLHRTHLKGEILIRISSTANGNPHQDSLGRPSIHGDRISIEIPIPHADEFISLGLESPRFLPFPELIVLGLEFSLESL
jgi:hypothetical protein